MRFNFKPVNEVDIPEAQRKMLINKNMRYVAFVRCFFHSQGGYYVACKYIEVYYTYFCGEGNQWSNWTRWDKFSSHSFLSQWVLRKTSKLVKKFSMPCYFLKYQQKMKRVLVKIQN